MIEDTTVIVDGKEYSIGRLDTKKQFHIGRRLAPMFTAWIASSGILADKALSKEKKVGDAIDMAAPMIKAIGEMSDADADFIIDNCLDVVKRKDGVGWQKVRVKGNIMYEDIDAVDMMQIVVAVINRDIAGFFPKLAGLATSAEEKSE